MALSYCFELDNVVRNCNLFDRYVYCGQAMSGHLSRSVAQVLLWTVVLVLLLLLCSLVCVASMAWCTNELL